MKSIGAAALAQLSAAELVALASETHAQIQELDGSERYLFQSLDSHQNETVIVVSELIIPETDTPGAKAARVNEFVDVMLTDWFDDEERARFFTGLARLDTDEGRFIDLDEADQVAKLTALEDEAVEAARASDGYRGPTAAPASPAGQPFFAVMKWLTLYGYFTSRVGMEQELGHEVFPGSYDGCVKL